MTSVPTSPTKTRNNPASRLAMLPATYPKQHRIVNELAHNPVSASQIEPDADQGLKAVRASSPWILGVWG